MTSKSAIVIVTHMEGNLMTIMTDRGDTLLSYRAANSDPLLRFMTQDMNTVSHMIKLILLGIFIFPLFRHLIISTPSVTEWEENQRGWL